MRAAMEDTQAPPQEAQPNGLLNVVWILTVAFGALAIYLAQGRWEAQLLLPLSLMVGYCLLGAFSKQRSVHRFADSIYFMGFLWTLVALAAATMRATGSEGAQLDAGTLARLFGVAVITTGAGMFLRVAVLNAFAEPEQVSDDQKAVAQLRQVYEQLITTMVHGGAQFDAAVGRTTVALEGLASTAEAGAELARIQVFKRIEDAATDAADRIRAGGETYRDGFGDAAVAVRDSGHAFADAQREFSEAVSGIGDTLNRASEQTEKMARAANASFQGAAGALHGAADSTREASSAVAEATRTIASVAASVGALNQQLDHLTQVIKQLEMQLNAVAAMSGQSATAIAEKATADLEHIEQAMGNVKGATEAVREGLLGLVRDIRQLLERLR